MTDKFSEIRTKTKLSNVTEQTSMYTNNKEIPNKFYYIQMKMVY